MLQTSVYKAIYCGKRITGYELSSTEKVYSQGDQDGFRNNTMSKAYAEKFCWAHFGISVDDYARKLQHDHEILLCNDYCTIFK